MDSISNPAVFVGWPIVRNFANDIIVLALIVIALATILRYQEYEAKKLLPGLIIAALLINFSLVICGATIDVSNIVMKELLLGGQKTIPNTGQGLYSIGKETLNGPIISTIDTSKNLTTYGQSLEIQTIMIQSSGRVFYYIARSVISILFAILFLFRIMALWILVILSPLAFACYVLPSTKKMVYDPWREAFIQWCFIGISAAVFIHLGDKIQVGMAKLPLGQGIAVITGQGGEYTQYLGGLFNFLVPGMFLIIGFIFSMKISVMGSSLAIKAGKYVKDKTVGAVMGTAKGVAGATGQYAANKSGLTRAREAISDRATRVGERLGFVARGTSALNQQERLKQNNAEKETAAATPEERQKVALGEAQGLSRGSALSEKAKNRRVEAIKQMAEKGELRNIKDVNKRKELMEYATSNGVSADLFTKGDPEMAEFDKKGIVEYQRTHAGVSEAGAIKALKSKAFAKMDSSDIPKFNNDDLIKLAESESAMGAKALEEAIKRGIVHQVKGGNLAEIGKLLNSAKSNYGSDAAKSAEKLDPRLAEHNENALNDYFTKNKINPKIATATQIADGKKSLVDDTYKKLDVAAIKSMETDAFDLSFVKNTTANKISKAGEELSKEKIKKLRDMLAAIDLAINEAYNRGLTNKAQELEAKYQAISMLK